MNTLFTLLLVVHIAVALGVIGLVLVQHGKGADMGAAFGSGASGSLFGATGSANFLSRSTAALAAIFFVTSLALAYIQSNKPKTSSSVMENAVNSSSVPAPAAASNDEKPAVENAAVSVDSGSKAKDVPN